MEPLPLDTAIAILLRHYTDEDGVKFGVAQTPAPTTDEVDNAWWSLARQQTPADTDA